MMNKGMVLQLSTDDGMTREEFLYELEKEVLNKSRLYLCDNLQPDRLFPYLQTKNCLSIGDCEQLRSMNTTRTRVDKLIDIVIRSGPGCLIKLIKAIKKSSKTQKYISDKLESRYKDLKNNDHNRARLEQTNNMVDRYRNTPPPPYTPMEHPTILNDSSYLSSVTIPCPESTKHFSLPAFENGAQRRASNPSVSRVPVLGDWPSPSRERAETTTSCVTDQYRDVLQTFHSVDYIEKPEGQVSIAHQREKMQIYTPSFNPDDTSRPKTLFEPSLPGMDDEEGVQSSILEQHREFEKLRPRHPDEHSLSSITHVKQLQETAPPSDEPASISPAPLESPPDECNDLPSYQLSNNESFEVSAGDSE